MNNPLINTNIKLIATKRFLLVFIGFISLFFGGVSAASAATLYFSPSSGSYNVGQTFSVSVYVSSVDQAMNAASGIISFPSDKLEVVSLSKNGSIFSLWVQEPTFSNSAGTINFEGIVFNPGFTGATGKIITVNFKVRSVGTVLLNFSSGSVLANDGLGTNILKSLGGATFSLKAAPPAITPLPKKEKEVVGLPAAPEISSITHPDPNKWYSKKDAQFIWQLPEEITALRLSVSLLPEEVPTQLYKPAFNFKEISGLTDGTWYLHLQFQNSRGWGEVSHFRFQIDTQPPEPIFLKVLEGEETDNPQPTIFFSAVDALSGIDYYRIKIGEGDSFVLPPEIAKNNFYTLPLQAPGKRTIFIQAFDKAGNFAVASTDFIIKSQPSLLIRIGHKIVNMLVIIIPLVALIVLLFFVLWYGWYKILETRRRFSKEKITTESILYKVFNIFKNSLQEQVKMLEEARIKRQLTDEEEKIILQFKRDLNNLEQFMQEK